MHRCTVLGEEIEASVGLSIERASARDRVSGSLARRAGDDPDSATGPGDAHRHLAIYAGGEADELLEGEAFDAAAPEVGRARLVDAEPVGDVELPGRFESIENGAGELLLEGGDGVSRIVHIAKIA
jgi:hypothetical protein